MKYADLEPLLVSKIHTYPMITFVDNEGVRVRNDLMLHADYMKLKDQQIKSVGTWLPFEITLDCSFDKLNINRGRETDE